MRDRNWRLTEKKREPSQLNWSVSYARVFQETFTPTICFQNENIIAHISIINAIFCCFFSVFRVTVPSKRVCRTRLTTARPDEYTTSHPMLLVSLSTSVSAARSCQSVSMFALNIFSIQNAVRISSDVSSKTSICWRPLRKRASGWALSVNQNHHAMVLCWKIHQHQLDWLQFHMSLLLKSGFCNLSWFDLQKWNQYDNKKHY